MGGRLFWLGVAGVFGTLSRYFLTMFIQKIFLTPYPWGTYAVNALGCLLFGFFWAISEETLHLKPEARMILLVGFLGAFTTFSSFAFESVQLFRASQIQRAIGYIFLQNFSGLLFVFVGSWVGKNL